MRRARVAPIVLVVSVVASAAGVRAQSAAVPEGWVVLPVDEYRALRERAIPPQPVPLPPPIDATLTRIDYDLHVEAEAVAGRAMLTIDVLRDGWSKLPIPAGLMVRDAALDGRRVSLVDGTPPHLLLSRAGRSVLALEVVIPVTSAGGTDSIVLPPSPSPISRARMTLPVDRVRLHERDDFFAEYWSGALHFLGLQMPFSAAHRLHSTKLSEVANVALYGKCNNPRGHGHRYLTEATISGRLDERSGTLRDLGGFNNAIAEALRPFQDKHLDLELAEFREKPSTGENIVQALWPRFDSRLNGQLARLRLWETANNRFTLRKL